MPRKAARKAKCFTTSTTENVCRSINDLPDSVDGILTAPATVEQNIHNPLLQSQDVWNDQYQASRPPTFGGHSSHRLTPRSDMGLGRGRARPINITQNHMKSSSLIYNRSPQPLPGMFISDINDADVEVANQGTSSAIDYNRRTLINARDSHNEMPSAIKQSDELCSSTAQAVTSSQTPLGGASNNSHNELPKTL